MVTKPSRIEPIANVPLASQVRAAILAAIAEKRFEAKLPPEDVLAEMLNVSRTTIRTALQGLEQDGIITRKRAIGTTINAHVKPSTLALQRMVGFDGLLREKGFQVEVELGWERGKPSRRMTEVFDLDANQDSLLTEKSYLADGVVAIVVHDVVPWSILRDQDFRGEVDPSIFAFSDNAWRQPVDHAVVEVLPEVQRADAPTRLGVSEGEAYTRLHELHYGTNGELLAVSTVAVDSSYVSFEVFRRR